MSLPASEGSGSWLERPVPVLLVGILLLLICAGFAYLWIADGLEWARALGLLSGFAGIYLTVGGVLGLRQQREE